VSSWCLLLCEGPHDQEFLCCLATGAGTWQHAKKRPEGVPTSLPDSGTDTATYLYLTQGDKTLVVASLNGVGNIIPDGEKAGSAELGRNLVESALTAASVGVMLDADAVGVVARRDAVRTHYSTCIAAAAGADHGKVVSPATGQADRRRFGLWVAPDGAADGSLDAVIRSAADAMHPELTPIADRFVTDLGKAANHQWEQFREKAVLGSLGQRWKAGSSLASALQERDQWMSLALTAREPFRGIIDFMAQLVA
jgi:hypothetical protein